MALFLRSKGYRAHALLGGLAGWLDAGYPVEEKARVQPMVSGVCAECGGALDTHHPIGRHTSPEQSTELFPEH